MINLKTFKLNANYVLVKVDAQLETYQRFGKETNLISPDFKYEKGEKINVKERNLSVMGTVYAVPSKLNFHLEEITDLKRNTCFAVIDGKATPINISIHRRIGNLTESSVLFNSEMELCTGDRINFSYMAHKKAKDDQMIVDTELGEMYLIKYDMIYMTLDENDKPKKMLNGYLLVEPEEIEVLKEGAQEFIEHTGGLVTLAPKFKQKKTKKNQIGKILLAGKRIKNVSNDLSGYLQHTEKHDCIQPLDLEEKIIYDPRLCQKLEFDTHQIMSDKVLHLIQRKDIHFFCTKDFDFSTLSLEKRRLANV